MNGIENAQHDLSDASFCLDTAIGLLDSIGTEAANDPEIGAIVRRLKELKVDLDSNCQLLDRIQNRIYDH